MSHASGKSRTQTSKSKTDNKQSILSHGREFAGDQTADVIVIGGGGAGMAAAVQAHQCGARVIILEKTNSVGGNTIMSGGALNAVDNGSRIAKQHDDSTERHFEQTYNGGDQQGNPREIRYKYQLKGS